MSYINLLKSYEEIFPSWNKKHNEYGFDFTSTYAEFFPRTDGKSEVTEDKWKLELDVPGFLKEQISVEITKNDYSDIVNIKAKSKSRSANFSYELKKNVFDYEKYSMNLELGVLTIEIPRFKDQNNSKTIELKF